jgi:mRNA interferase RelE/StbE
MTTMAGSKARKRSGGKANESAEADVDGTEVFELEWTEYSKADYDSLEGSQLVFVDKALDRIRLLGMQAGTPLTGVLAGCRRLKHRKLGLRVVFRQSEKGIQIVQIVAIGKREDSAVYKQANVRRKV